MLVFALISFISVWLVWGKSHINIIEIPWFFIFFYLIFLFSLVGHGCLPKLIFLLLCCAAPWAPAATEWLIFSCFTNVKGLDGATSQEKGARTRLNHERTSSLTVMVRCNCEMKDKGLPGSLQSTHNRDTWFLQEMQKSKWTHMMGAEGRQTCFHSGCSELHSSRNKQPAKIYWTSHRPPHIIFANVNSTWKKPECEINTRYESHNNMWSYLTSQETTC